MRHVRTSETVGVGSADFFFAMPADPGMKVVSMTKSRPKTSVKSEGDVAADEPKIADGAAKAKAASRAKAEQIVGVWVVPHNGISVNRRVAETDPARIEQFGPWKIDRRGKLVHEARAIHPKEPVLMPPKIAKKFLDKGFVRRSRAEDWASGEAPRPEAIDLVCHDYDN